MSQTRGATVEAERIRQSIFRVLSVIQASQEYPTLHSAESQAVKPTPLYALITEHAEPQLVEGLLLIAVALRVHNERHGRKLFDNAGDVGYLNETTRSSLSMKDACDKIIHADDLRLGGGTKPWEVKEFDRQLPGPYVIATAHLRGINRRKPWKADLDIWAFCEAATRLTQHL